MIKEFKQLVIVCRDIEVNWKQFINPIYVGVESGILALLKNKLPIEFICGDFDSLSKQEIKEISQKKAQLKFQEFKFNNEKDNIDAEIAITEAIRQKLDFQQIVLITEGERWDMILAQLNLLNKYENYQPILMTTNNYAFSLKNNQTYSFNDIHLQYHYISLFALNCQEVIYNFTGCKYYPNQDITINNRDILAISNEFDNNIKDKKLIIKKGKCLVILYKNN